MQELNCKMQLKQAKWKIVIQQPILRIWLENGPHRVLDNQPDKNNRPKQTRELKCQQNCSIESIHHIYYIRFHEHRRICLSNLRFLSQYRSQGFRFGLWKAWDVRHLKRFKQIILSIFSFPFPHTFWDSNHAQNRIILL